MIPSLERRVGRLILLVTTLLLCLGVVDLGRAESAGNAEKKTPAPACNRASFRVVVDVGHTAEAPGAISARGAREYDFNLRLAKPIAQKLNESGFERTVLLVTEGPSRKGLKQRVARANGLSADLLLSIHHDSVPDSFLEKWEFEGTERKFSDRFEGHSIFISNDGGDPRGSLLFGRLLGNELKARGLRYTPHYTQRFMGHRQRILVDADAGVYRYDQLIVLKNTRIPAVLLEAGSIINRNEELLVSSPERQALISASVVDAVDNFCAARMPHAPERIAHRPAGTAAAKAGLLNPLAAMRPAANSKQR